MKDQNYEYFGCCEGCFTCVEGFCHDRTWTWFLPHSVEPKSPLLGSIESDVVVILPDDPTVRGSSIQQLSSATGVVHTSKDGTSSKCLYGIVVWSTSKQRSNDIIWSPKSRSFGFVCCCQRQDAAQNSYTFLTLGCWITERTTVASKSSSKPEPSLHQIK